MLKSGNPYKPIYFETADYGFHLFVSIVKSASGQTLNYTANAVVIIPEG